MEFSRPEYWSGKPFPSPGDLPNSGIKPKSPTLQVDSLPTEPPGKPKNTGVGSLSLLQRNFPMQELNRGLQHCKQILYQLSYPSLRRGSYKNGHLAVFADPYLKKTHCLRKIKQTQADKWKKEA